MIEKIKEETEKLKREVKQRLLSYLVAAFGFVAGLAWNDAIKDLIDLLFPLNKNSVWAKFAYAGLVTIVVVAVTVYLIRFFERQTQRQEERKQ